MNSNKPVYKQFCEKHPEIPLFSQYWWMEAVCAGRKWDVLFVRNATGKIIASMPFEFKKKWGLRYILQPMLTQTSGIWIDYPEGQTENERLSYEKKICNNIISQLDTLKLAVFLQHFHFSFTNWLPFYWRGFSQTTRYTYRIPDISDLNNVFANFSDSNKRHIRKAEKELKVSFELSPEEFYEHKTRSLLPKGKKNECPKSLFLACYNASVARNQGMIIAIKDQAGNFQAGAFIVWDKQSAYYMIPFASPEFRSSGASSLLVWEALKFLSGKTKSFDFEGSMIENTENAYRRFGSIQTPYSRIRRSSSKWIDCFVPF
ncbi:MAG: GNAT family N-acetyltransferase [Prevotellaceae bacterium]|jgi:hypothetical protein|nr:GNAT family N-acetyltransferase [Prevotellaceae bacterium]